MQGPIYSELCADPELQEIVADFVDELPRRVDAMRESFLAGSWDVLQTLAHQVKGAAGSYGFAPVTPIAGEIENGARNRAPEHEIERAITELQNLVSRLTAEPSGE
jgi:HPt (histidine-containing phosphotransfer) domain-containing protein